MTDRILYALPIPSDAQTRSSASVQRNLSKQGVLQSDVGAVDSVSLDPGQRLLKGEYRARYAALLATQLEELFDAGGIEVVPFFARDGSSAEDGYYALESTNVGPSDPRSDGVTTFDGKLTKRGTRRSHWRALATVPQDVSASNDFADGQPPLVALPTRARRVRWFDEVSGAREPATAVETRVGELASLAYYDVTEPAFTDPQLIYDIPYDQEWRADCRVWDDYGRTKEFYGTIDTSPPVVGSATVGSDSTGDSPDLLVQSTWQRVYGTDHQWQGLPVLENQRLRVVPDERLKELRVWRWDKRGQTYHRLSLGPGSWRLYDFDVTRIGTESISAQVEFRDASTSPASFFSLDMTLLRGYDEVLWTVPPNESGSTPSGLVSRLDPIAAGLNTAPNGESTLTKRSEVRR